MEYTEDEDQETQIDADDGDSWMYTHSTRGKQQ